MPFEKLTRIGILISGRGSNMLALDDAVREGLIPKSQIVLVISDKKEAPGLARARERGLTTLILERRGLSREQHELQILAALQEHQVQIVCLAGFMRLLSSQFINEFPGPILNIHPSLLPAFPGLDAQEKALDHGVKWSGCTVHLVDEHLDAGPIVAQRAVPVLPDDTVETLSARILDQEHELYPEAVALIASGNYEIVGRRVITKH